jgi:RND family efflux transporter MFP subunit
MEAHLGYGLKSFAAQLLCVFALLVACGEADEQARAPDVIRPAYIYEVPVNEMGTWRHFIGRVEASRRSVLSFQTPGRLVEFPVLEGEIITQGELIAALDPADHERAVREAELRLRQLGQELERHKALYDRGHLPKAGLDATQTQYDLAEVALENARQNLAYTRIEAPFDAFIARRLVDNYTNVAAGQPVVRIQDLSTIDIVVTVPEGLIATVTEQDVLEATAEFAFLPGRLFPLEYKEHGTEPDPVTQTYRITVSMARPQDVEILPGMAASVRARIRPRETEAVRIPLSALNVDMDGRYHVWIFDSETGTVASRTVSVDEISPGTAIITDGLRPGELIVRGGVRLLREGMRVRPVETG